MKSKKNVLVFPCGSEIGLEINRALAHDIHFELFGASSLPDHGRYVYKNYIEGLPFVEAKHFIESLNQVCDKFEIDFIIPAHDSVVLKLAQHATKLKAQLITSPRETCEIARSKKKTYQKLKDVILCPQTYEIDDEIEFPVFIKPDVGQGSKGAKRCDNRNELEVALNNNPDIVISELLTGEEYTIDCFTNKNGQLLFVGGRERSRTNNGISVNSYPVSNPEFQTIAEKINSVIHFKGMWFFQLKRNTKGELALLEIAPRIAGTMCLYRGHGVNFILLALYDAMDIDVSIIKNHFDIEIDRALTNCYRHNIDYDYVYIDFDDTIILGDKVNTQMMAFIYQAKNDQKKLILITKHARQIHESLVKFHIDQALFNEIIHLEPHQQKVDFMLHKKAVFIDDSFAERKKIAETLKIPVFGIDAIDVLMHP